MNFQSIVMITVFSSSVWMVAAAPETSVGPSLKAQAKPLADLIQDLADDKFRVRENASLEI